MLTTAEAARILGVTKTAIQRAADEGRLRCQRAADGSRAFAEADVAAWGEQRKGRRRRSQPRGPTSGANLSPAWGPTNGPTSPPTPAGQDYHPDAGAQPGAQLGARLGGANLGGANQLILATPAACGWTPERFAVAYRLLDRAKIAPEEVLGALAALWPRMPTPDEIEAVGDRAKRLACSAEDDFTRARSAGECLTCLGFGARPFWAEHVRDLPDRWGIDAALYASPAGRMLVACERCPGPAIDPMQMPEATCPACNGSGIAPVWVGVAFLGGRSNIDLGSPSDWGPSVCGLCLGWGRLAPMVAERSATDLSALRKEAST